MSLLGGHFPSTHPLLVGCMFSAFFPKLSCDCTQKMFCGSGDEYVPRLTEMVPLFSSSALAAVKTGNQNM